MADRANDHQQIGLPRREAGQRRTKAIEVVARSRRGHELHSAAGSDERIEKERVLAAPVDHGVDGRREEGIVALAQDLARLRHRRRI